MRLLDNITQDPKQVMYINIINYDAAKFTIWYKPQQFGWFYDLEWGSFATYNQRIVVSTNFTRQYKNILPFGLLCITDNQTDPIFQESFTTNCQIYVLDTADIEYLEATFYG